MSRVILVGLLAIVAVPAASGQILSDTLFTWRAYAREGMTRVTVYRNPADSDRPHTIVMKELAANRGPATTADSRHLVELVGRQFALDPTEVTWVFHWGSFSFADAPDSRRELLLRATFRRLPSGNLSTPTWRVLARPEVEALTARRFE